MRKFILLATVALMATTGAAFATTHIGHKTHVKVHVHVWGEVSAHTHHGAGNVANAGSDNWASGNAHATTIGGDKAWITDGIVGSHSNTGATGDDSSARAKGEAELLAKAKAGHHRRAWVRLEAESRSHSWSDGNPLNTSTGNAWAAGSGNATSGPTGASSNAGGAAGATTGANSSGGGSSGSSASASGGGSAGTK
jgi:hypothetical protein